MDHDFDHRHSPLDERCVRHQFEPAIDRCRQCGNAFCGECLVYSFGPKEAPFCVPCALAAAGVRSTAGRAPVASKREMRRREKEARQVRRNEAPPSRPTIDWSIPPRPGETDPLHGNGDPIPGEGAPATNGHRPPAPDGHLGAPDEDDGGHSKRRWSLRKRR